MSTRRTASSTKAGAAWQKQAVKRRWGQPGGIRTVYFVQAGQKDAANADPTTRSQGSVFGGDKRLVV